MKNFLSTLKARATLIIAAALALLAFSPCAKAQWNLQLPVPGGTNNCTATTTNTTFTTSQPTAAFTVPPQTDLPIQIVFKLTGSGTSACVFKFDESADNVNWKANAYSVTVTANGTSTVNNTGNFNIKGMPFLRLQTIENPNASAITNLLVQCIEKQTAQK